MEYDEMINQKKVSIWNTKTDRFSLDRVRINYNNFLLKLGKYGKF